MFKLVKILSSGSNVPDPIRLPTDTESSYAVGSALVFSEGKLINGEATTMPTHIALESAEVGEKSTLLCYMITPSMVFEVAIAGNPVHVSVGSKAALSKVDGYFTKIDIVTTNGVATIIDKNGAVRANEKMFVIFE